MMRSASVLATSRSAARSVCTCLFYREGNVGETDTLVQRLPVDLGVAAQFFALEAKARARIGDRRQSDVALDEGRRLLDSLPYPENLDHHFVVDPTKFDFYAMDCYRTVGDNKMAENLADEVIHASTDFDGRERAPMRLAEGRITLGVVRAREGELESAVEQGSARSTVSADHCPHR